MNKPELLKRLDALIDYIKQERIFGEITIAFRDGEPDLLRKQFTEKLNGVQGNSHAKTSYR